ncbi:MAG: hypothetical protein P8N72_13110 [Flavimaricola sp.]|nr:hypothetical protein [Flavimaricola sp.]
MSLKSFFLNSGSVLALVLASSAQADPVVDTAQCAVDAADCIVITQSAGPEADREPGIAANTADVTLDGTQTTILAYEDLAQSGNGNSATFAITGDQNTFLFAQSGNSILAITVNGTANTVSLFELGGVADRLASLTLDIAGDANTVDILSQRAEIAAELLDIDILGFNNILEVKFEDYAEILTSIMGDGNAVAITQNNPMMDNGYIAVTLLIEGAESRDNIVNILQSGLEQSIAVTLDGADNRLDLSQSIDFGMNNRADATISGTENDIAITQAGDMNEVELDLVGNDNILRFSQEFFSTASVVQRGSFNSMYLNIGPEQNARFDLRGDWNHIDLRSGWGGFYFDTGEPTMYMTIDGNHNHVWNHTEGSSRSRVAITGSRNSYSMMSFHFSMYPVGEALTEKVDILGDDNILFSERFDDFGGDLTLDATVRGDENTFMMQESVGLPFFVEGNTNRMDFDHVRATDYDVQVVGNDNSVDMDDSVLANSATRIMGNDNTLSVSDLSPRELHNEIIGDGNILTFNDQAGISAMFAYQTEIWGSQNVLTVSSAHEGSYDPADYVGSVILDGDRNRVSVIHGLASFDVNLVGSDHVFDVTYDPALNAYTHAITSVGSGTAVFTSDNGVMSISRSGV